MNKAESRFTQEQLDVLWNIHRGIADERVDGVIQSINDMDGVSFRWFLKDRGQFVLMFADYNIFISSERIDIHMNQDFQRCDGFNSMNVALEQPNKEQFQTIINDITVVVMAMLVNLMYHSEPTAVNWFGMWGWRHVKGYGYGESDLNREAGLTGNQYQIMYGRLMLDVSHVNWPSADFPYHCHLFNFDDDEMNVRQFNYFPNALVVGLWLAGYGYTGIYVGDVEPVSWLPDHLIDE